MAPRAAGSRLVWPSSMKVKGINQVHASASGGGGWRFMWDGAYDWNGWLKPGIDLVASLGANTIKICGLGPAAISGATFQRSLVDRVRKYLDYAGEKGLLVYWQPDTHSLHSWSDAELLAAAVQNALILADYPNVIGIDLYNEYDMSRPGFHGLVFGQVRSVCNLPLSISNAAIPSSGSWFEALGGLVDFWDLHSYAATLPSELSFYRSSSGASGKPFIIGESGSPRWPGSPFPSGPDQQMQRWTRLAVMSEQPDSLGAVGFSLTDYDQFLFGVCDEDFAQPRPEITAPFAWWRDIR